MKSRSIAYVCVLVVSSALGAALFVPAFGGEADEIEALRRAAEAEAAGEEAPEKEAGETTFKSGGLALQKLNPEISVTGDMFLKVSGGDDVNQESDFTFRGLGLHMEAYLDPYTRFKAAVPVNENEAKVGEAYLTRYGVFRGASLTAGKFRQQFAVVNRWHKHGLDYVDFPMPLRRIFGEGGLNQVGLALDWSGSAGTTTHGLTFQVTDGQNPVIFDENSRNRPSILARYSNYRDLSRDTYLEFGVTAMNGWNDDWTIGAGTDHDSRTTQVYALDCALLWEPAERMRYRHVEWRTELYYVQKGILAPDGSGDDTLAPWGVFTSLQTKVTRTIDVGMRLDYYRPDEQNYAYSPHAVVEDGANRWLAAAYVTWWQSPFVKFRLEYDHEDGEDMGEPEDRVMLQCVFAAGPHKHERY
jgi:hypothetical protein